MTSRRGSTDPGRTAGPDVGPGSGGPLPSPEGPAAALPGELPLARVLIVDDETDLLRSMRARLRSRPFELFTAASAGEALELLETTAVDVVVSDQRMPGMSGSEFLSLVRRKYPETVRLMLTGESDLTGAIRSINEAQIFRFLVKPCPAEELARRIDEALEQCSDRRARARDRRLEVMARAAREAEFEAALASTWMAFQPVVDPGAGSTVAYESLLRVDSRGVPHPGELLRLAEELERIDEVEHRALSLAAERIADAPLGSSVLVNVHPHTLDRDDFLGVFQPLVPHAERVVLEIIEREALADTVELQDRLSLLRERGFRVAVDDLGAGYSGLTSFVLLKPDIVKFDMQLIRGIDQDPTRTKLVAALTGLCRDMGITSIAEGVETREELQRVVEVGCDWVQGFYFARPAREFYRPSL